MDFVAVFAAPLPVRVIAELLGWPETERHRLRPWSAQIVRLYEKDYTSQDEERAESATTEFAAMLTKLAAERRVTPRDDLISALVAVRDQGDGLTGDELHIDLHAATQCGPRGDRERGRQRPVGVVPSPGPDGPIARESDAAPVGHQRDVAVRRAPAALPSLRTRGYGVRWFRTAVRGDGRLPIRLRKPRQPSLRARRRVRCEAIAQPASRVWRRVRTSASARNSHGSSSRCCSERCFRVCRCCGSTASHRATGRDSYSAGSRA